MHSESGIRLLDCSKFDINQKDDKDVIIFWHDFIVKLFWRSFVSLVKFSYRSKFHVSIITGSGVMTISFYKRLARNLETRIAPSPFYLISGDWHKLRTPNLVRMFLIKCYCILQNSRVTAFTVSKFLRKNNREEEGEGVTLPSAHMHHPHTSIRVNLSVVLKKYFEGVFTF